MAQAAEPGWFLQQDFIARIVRSPASCTLSVEEVRAMAVEILWHRAAPSGAGVAWTPPDRGKLQEILDSLQAASRDAVSDVAEKIATWIEGYGNEPVDARLAANAIREQRWR